MKKLKIFFDKNKNFRFEGIGILVHESEWIERQMNMNFFPNFIIYTNFSFSCYFFQISKFRNYIFSWIDSFVLLVILHGNISMKEQKRPPFLHFWNVIWKMYTIKFNLDDHCFFYKRERVMIISQFFIVKMKKLPEKQLSLKIPLVKNYYGKINFEEFQEFATTILPWLDSSMTEFRMFEKQNLFSLGPVIHLFCDMILPWVFDLTTSFFLFE